MSYRLSGSQMPVSTRNPPTLAIPVTAEYVGNAEFVGNYHTNGSRTKHELGLVCQSASSTLATDIPPFSEDPNNV